MALLRRIAFKVETVNKVHLLCAIELMVPIEHGDMDGRGLSGYRF